jgi:stearoyl-CoA desaturase (delta-9 desaturase)
MSARLKLPILEPTFGYGTSETKPYTPSISEIILEWWDAMNVFRPSRTFTVLNFGFHFSTFFVFVYFVIARFSFPSLLFILIAVFVLGTVFNTVWYHRYCSHASFRFKSNFFARLFLWTNPILFREECYAIPHMIHHQRTEKPGDPYGPHLGWLGSYLAAESAQKTNTKISEEEYASLCASIAHIPLRFSSYNQFVRTGSVENARCYLPRVLCIQLFWGTGFFLIGGTDLVWAWFAAIFAITFLIRDFNWRGHGGNIPRQKKPGWEFDDKSHALNQWFYGYLASEWHDNHHRYSFSANNGFLPGQIDVAFLLIKLMYRLGIVESYVDARPIFQKEWLGYSPAKPAPRPI